MNKIYSPLALLIIIILFFLRLLPYKHVYLESFNLTEITRAYQSSQFAPLPQHRQEVIQDWDLYPYAGVIYLTTGELGKINIEHPPLGKYLLAISYLLLGNPTIVQLPLAIIFLFFVFLISKKFLKNEWLALTIPLLLLTEPMFIFQATHSHIDLFLAAMTAVFLWLVLIRKRPGYKDCILLGLVLGIITSIKFPALALILAICYFLSWLVKSRKNPWQLLITFGLAILVYLAAYSPFLISSGFSGFIDLQSRALRLHLSHVPEYPPLAPLRVMFFNQWPTWWDPNIPVLPTTDWQITWPLLAMSILASPILYWKSNNKKPILILFLFCWAYFIFINSRLFFPGYLLIILPYLYLFLILELKLIREFLIKSLTD